jgi:hypothetical protein
VAIESRKQAASLPRPPLPSAASGSHSITSSSDGPGGANAAAAESRRSSADKALFIARPIRNSIDR